MQIGHKVFDGEGKSDISDTVPIPSSPSLRSYSVDSLAHSHLLPPLDARIKTKATLVPVLKNKNESLGTLFEEGEQDNGDSAILKVCQECKTTLLHAFEHCLSKNGDYEPLPSTHEINEVKDAELLSQVPYFDILKDPTRHARKPNFLEPSKIVEKERWILKQQKDASKALEMPYNAKKMTSSGVKQGKKFCGTIYKRMLEAKEHEITKLRGQLYETLKREQFESTNVKKLRVALGRSVNFYTFAEEWQQSETARLQEDVKHLKAETSSLMAFLINAEVEKHQLLKDIANMKNIVELKVEETAKAVKQMEEMKEKLQDAYKEFIEIDKHMADLRREAKNGSAAVESRNELLQKNLMKLTADFEVGAKDLRQAQNKIRELEFEMEQMINELNFKGDSLKKANDTIHLLRGQVDTITTELTKVQQNFTSTMLDKEKLMADAKIEKARTQKIEIDLKVRVSTLEDDLSKEKLAKQELEIVSNKDKEEIRVMKTDLKNITAERNNYQAQYEALLKSSRSEISSKKAIIDELQKKISKDAMTLANAIELKEQMMFQVTDLKNNLEIESANAKNLSIELDQIKKTMDDKAIIMNQQIEKLTVTKNLLVADKKEMTDEIKALRKKLEGKSEDLVNCQNLLQATRKEAKEREESLQSSLDDIHQKYQDLDERYVDVCERETAALTKIDILERSISESKQQSGKLEWELERAKKSITSLMADNKTLNERLENAQRDYDLLTDKYESSLGGQDDIAKKFETFKVESGQVIEKLQTQIEEVKKAFRQATIENETMRNTNRDLMIDIEELKRQLVLIQQQLEKETLIREHMEVQLDKNRQSHQSEKRIRSELERMQARLKVGSVAKEAVSWDEWQVRDHKLTNVTLSLTQETERLKEVISLLPKNGFGEESSFQWPSDLKPTKKR